MSGLGWLAVTGGQADPESSGAYLEERVDVHALGSVER